MTFRALVVVIALACSAAGAQELAVPTATKTVRLVCAIDRGSIETGMKPFETNGIWCQITDTLHVPQPFGGSSRTSVDVLFEGASRNALDFLNGVEDHGSRYLRRVCPTMMQALLDEMVVSEELADAAMIPNYDRIAINCNFSMPTKFES